MAVVASLALRSLLTGCLGPLAVRGSCLPLVHTQILSCSHHTLVQEQFKAQGGSNQSVCFEKSGESRVPWGTSSSPCADRDWGEEPRAASGCPCPQQAVSQQRKSHMVPGLAHVGPHAIEWALGITERAEEHLDSGTAGLCRVPLRVMDAEMASLV